MPVVVEILKGNVLKVGESSLTDGELVQAVDHRKGPFQNFSIKMEAGIVFL